MSNFFKCFFYLLVFCWVNSSHAAVMMLNQQVHQLPVTTWYSVPLSATVPRERQAFEQWQNGLTAEYGVSDSGGRYLVTFAVNNETDATQWVLDTEQYLSKSVDILYFDENSLAGNWIHSGFQQVDEFLLSYARTISLPPSRQSLIAVIVESPEFIQPPSFSLSQRRDFVAKHNNKTFWVIVFIGVLFGACAINFFLVMVGMKSSIAKMYSLYLLSLLAAWLGRYEAFHAILGYQFYELMYVPYLLLPLFGGYFCIWFLQIDRYLPGVASILKINGWLAFLFAIVSPWFYSYANNICSLFVSVWVILAIVAGVWRHHRGYKPARYYLLAFVWLALPTAFIIPRNFGIYDPSWFDIELFTLIGGAMDALFLAIALGYRANQLQENVIKLQDADLSKNQFLANMSHEIRTPLTSIIGYSESLGRGEIKPEDRTDAINTITDSGYHLLNIINNILDLSKIQANKVNYEFSSVDTIELIDSVKSLLEENAKSKNISLLVDYHFPLPKVINTDPLRLKQVLINLVTNGIKFTNDGYVRIDVSYSRGEQYLSISVSDTGIGMSFKQQRQVFDPFYQVEPSSTSMGVGSGLGLNIAKSLIEGMKGIISVRSKIGLGSKFVIRLPQESVPKNWVSSLDTSESVESSVDSNLQLPSHHHKTVLIVEDHDNNRRLLKTMLQSVGVNTVEASNGVEALRKVLDVEIDLVLMDINMPLMDGVQALNTMRMRGFNKPVIALTANAMQHEVEQYLADGFNAHIAKPILREPFYQTLERFFAIDTDDTREPNQLSIALMIEDFIGDIPRVLKELITAILRGDEDAAKSQAHREKGAAGSFGIQQMSSCLEEIEQLLMVGDRDEAVLQLKRFERYSHRYTKIKGIAIGSGVVEFDNDIELLYQHIQPAINHLAQSIEALLPIAAVDSELSYEQQKSRIAEAIPALIAITESHFLTALEDKFNVIHRHIINSGTMGSLYEQLYVCHQYCQEYQRLLNIPNWRTEKS